MLHTCEISRLLSYYCDWVPVLFYGNANRTHKQKTSGNLCRALTVYEEGIVAQLTRDEFIFNQRPKHIKK